MASTDFPFGYNVIADRLTEQKLQNGVTNTTVPLDYNQLSFSSPDYTVDDVFSEQERGDMLASPAEVLVYDKCHANYTDVECATPASWAKVHYDQFGRKYLHIYCEACRKKWYDTPRGLTEEEELLRKIFNEPPEDIIWESYKEESCPPAPPQ
jgi:hypothetical protein